MCILLDYTYTGFGRKKSPIWEANKFKIGEFFLPHPAYYKMIHGPYNVKITNIMPLLSKQIVLLIQVM